jgi:hypothetical protein
MTLKERYETGETWADFVARPKQYGELWGALNNRVALDDEILRRARDLECEYHLLVLSEDWCGDSINILPLVGKLVESVRNIDLRVLSRDSNLDIMDAHLTGSSRSIPVVIVLDQDYVERGWWGPRPRPLQEWVKTEGILMQKADRYREVRSWYARDRGKTTLNELLDLMEAATTCV